MLQYVCAGSIFVGLLMAVSAPAMENDARLPLSFEKHGERFVARGKGYAVGLDNGRVTIEVVADDKTVHAVSLEFAGGRKPEGVPSEELPGKVNYYAGNDPRKWQIGLPTYGKVKYRDVYTGIDVAYYGNRQEIEFDLIVKPGADPEAIRLKVGGAGKVSIDGSGALDFAESAAGLKIALPEIYQEVNGAKKRVPGRYAIVGRDEVAFKIDPWDRTRALVIDPAIVYSTLFGGGLGSNQGYGIGLDSQGNIVMAGDTTAADFPALDAAQNVLKGNTNVIVTKINPAGTALIYSTYLGGSGDDSAYALAVDSTGAAWVTGSTDSNDFPLMTAAQPIFAGSGDAFVARLDGSGVLQFSTFLGGNSSTQGSGIAVDNLDNGYVTGGLFYSSYGFPTTAGVIQPQGGTAFVTKYDPTGTVVYSTLLGGGSTTAYGIAVDSSHNVYVTGSISDYTFPGAPSGGAQPFGNGNPDAFIVKLNADATAYLYFTFLGGAGYDWGQAIAVDSLGNAYVAGQTSSTGLATTGAAQTALAGGTNTFAAKLNPSGTKFSYVTYLGGSRVDNVGGVALDGSGNLYVAGYTDSTDFPTVSPVQPMLPGNVTSLYNSTNSGGAWSAFDSTLPGAVFAVSINPSGGSAVVLTESGIYRTTNNGALWTRQLNQAFVSFFDYYLARSPVSPGTIYSAGCCVIHQSLDDGVTWNLYGGAVAGEAQGIVADPLTANTLYVIDNTSPYVFKSTDGGLTSNPAPTGLPGTPVVSMAATADGSLYAGISGSGVYKSTNQGGSWTVVNTGLPSAPHVFANSLSASGNTVYFASGTIYKTTNGGAAWVQVPGSPNAYQVAASPQDASFVYAFTENNTVEESTDGGATWNSPGTPVAPNVSRANAELVVDPSSSAHVLVVAGVNQAAFVAKLNGTGSALTWSTYLGGTNSTQANAIATDGIGDAFVTGSARGGGFPATSTALPAEGSGGTQTFITEISDATAACSVLSVNPGSALAPQNGGTLNFSVVAPSGCAWSAMSNESWAMVSGGASGAGAGIVTVLIAANSSGAMQSATLTVGSRQITITQPSNTCAYSMSTSSYPIAAPGGAISAFLTATAGCPWAVTNNYSSAISFTSASSGTGSAPLVMTVTPNFGSNSRYFTLSVGTASIQIAQVAAGSTASQTIQFDAIPNQILGISPFVIAAEAGSLLPVTFVSTTPAICKLALDLVMLLKAGTCSITASQPGNAGYSAATSVTQSFTVSKAKVSGSFMTAAGTSLAPGAEPQSVAIADFNGDGIPDLAMTGNDSVTVFLGNGSGGFTAAPGSPIAVETGAVSVVVGDFNGDGIPDLATSGGGSATVLLGNGSGGFTAAPGSPFTAGSSPVSYVVAGDFNGDGIQDLATANYFSNDVTVLLGNGSGGFTAGPGSPFAVGQFPRSVVVGDFNRDGIQDLAVANSLSGNVTVLLGNGSGGFTATTRSPFVVGTIPYSVVVGDFNGDGIQDLATANLLSDNVTVLLGNGSGGFTATTGSPFAVGTQPFSVVVGDFNGDGIQDLAAANEFSNNVTVLLGNGSGGFAALTGSPIAVGSNPYSVTVGDFNRDGIEDLVTANFGGNNVTVLLGAVVGATPQTITFSSPSTVTYGIAPFTIGATSTSGLPVSFASFPSPVCTVSGATVMIVGGGACTIVASQPGNATYAAAATVRQSFIVNPAAQTITFGLLNDQLLNGTAPPPLSATATSGLTVAFTSNSLPVCTVSDVYITLLITGTCSITASQAGNASYTPAAPVTRIFTVSTLGIQPAAAFLDQTGAPALTFNGSTNFPDAGGFLIGAPGVTQDLNGNVYVVGLDSAGGVHLNSYSFANSTWNGWQYSGGILDTSSGLTAAVGTSGVVWFSGRDIGNRHWINSWNGVSFGGWILVADGIFSSGSTPQIAVTADGTVWIIGTDIGGRVWSNSYNPTNQTFTGWVDRQAISIGQPSVTAGQDGFVYVAVRSVMTNSPVYLTRIPAQNAATSNTWLSGGGLIDTDPQITSQGGTVYLMSLAGNNTVYLLTFSEANQTFGTWTFTNGILNSATIAAAAGNVFIAGLDSADRVYWYSLTGNNWSFSGGAGASATVLAGGK